MSILSSLGFKDEDSPKAKPVEETTEGVFTEEISADAQSIIEAAKGSMDFLAAIALPLVYRYAFPPIFLSIWNWLTDVAHRTRDFSQLAIGLPRGFGKTLVIKLFILYLILFTKKKFILITCETQTKANNIIADVMDALSEGNIRRIFGDWELGKETDRQDLKKFGFRGRAVILMGVGVDSSVRGITLKNERPDVMIFDDIQSRECADSQVQTDKLEREFMGTFMKAKSPHGCMFVFIANMYPTKWSLLRKLKYNPEWTSFIVGGILADGTSLWEELQPIEQLLKELKNDISMGRSEIFFAEVLNDETASSNYLIDLSKLPELPYTEGDIALGNYVIIDPATDKLGADDVSIGYFEIYNGLPVLRELIADKLSPGDTIRKTLEICLRRNCRLIAIESNAYQYTLKYWFNFIMSQLGLAGIEAVDIYSGSLSKNSRIIAMLRAYGKGDLFIDPSCRPLAHLQITQFNPLKRDNADGILDLLTYASRVLEVYGEYIQITNILEDQEFGNIEVLPPEITCPF